MKCHNSITVKSFNVPEWVQNLDLSITEKFFLSLLLSLDNQDHCYASNDHLAKRMGLSQSRISFYINKFKKMGLLKQLSEVNDKRVIQVVLPKSSPEKEKVSKKESFVKTRGRGTCFHDSPHIYREQDVDEEQQQEKVVVVSLDEDEKKRKEILEPIGLNPSFFYNVSISSLESHLMAAKQYAEKVHVESYQSLCAKAIRQKWQPNITKPKEENQQASIKKKVRLECLKRQKEYQNLFSINCKFEVREHSLDLISPKGNLLLSFIEEKCLPSLDGFIKAHFQSKYIGK